MDTRINQVEAVFTRIDVCDDSVVHVNKRLLSLLYTQQHPIQKFNLIHFVAAKVDPCLTQAAWMLSDLHTSLNKTVHKFLFNNKNN